MEAITDRDVVAVLRPFVRATGPVLDGLREANPLGLRDPGTDLPTGRSAGGRRRRLRRLHHRLTRLTMPGTAAWAAMTLTQRCDWWTNRVGRFTALLAAVPGLGGALADRLPVRDALGAAGQGLVLCAIAGENGVRDPADRVRLLAWVLFHRAITPELARGTRPATPELARPATSELARPAASELARGARQSPLPAGPALPGATLPGPVRSGVADPQEDARTAELAGELAEVARGRRRITLGAVGGALWRLGRALWSLGDELGKRPQGRFYHRWLGAIPIVGVLADYLGERSAMRRLRRRAVQWFEQERQRSSSGAGGAQPGIQ